PFGLEQFCPRGRGRRPGLPGGCLRWRDGRGEGEGEGGLLRRAAGWRLHAAGDGRERRTPRSPQLEAWGLPAHGVDRQTARQRSGDQHRGQRPGRDIAAGGPGRRRRRAGGPRGLLRWPARRVILSGGGGAAGRDLRVSGLVEVPDPGPPGRPGEGQGRAGVQEGPAAPRGAPRRLDREAHRRRGGAAAGGELAAARHRPDAGGQADRGRQVQQDHGELLAEERALRGEILRWLEQWPKRRGNAGKVMKLSDCGQDVDVHRVRQALLPSSVQLREWIERRIGGEVELSKDEQGWFLICLRGPPPGGAANAAAAEAFFSGLPRGELNEQEQILRQSVLFYLELHSGDEPGPLLSEAGQDPAVMVAREGFLPEEVTLRTWLERRLASDVQMVQDQKSGVWLIQPAGWVPPPAPLKADGPPPTKEEFFSSLPADSFLDAEEDLREGILTFLESWKESMSPTLASVGKDITVRNSRAKVMPKGTPVTLKEWLERRMGGEIELASDFSGQLRFGFRGELRLPAAAGGKRKRASRSPGARRERAPARPREPRGPPPRPRPRAVCAEGARPRSGPGAPSGGRAALLPHSRPHLFQGKGKPKSSNRGSATESIRVPQNGFPLEATTHT
ncbi:unnamed protein product, partial [Prorocentrum cordatum]